MFAVNIITIGKNKDAWVDDAIAHYLKLLKRYAAVSLIYVPDTKQSATLSEAELMKKEARRLRKNFRSDYRIALSDRGRRFDSIQFANYLADLMRRSRGSVDFIIGGIYGLDETMIAECRETVSLSPMTMSHQLIRPVLLEQLYRGFSILSGGHYHK